MSERPGTKKSKQPIDETLYRLRTPAHQPEKPTGETLSPQIPSETDYEDIPVDELIRLTRELTQRITNADRQRLVLELQETGHQRTIRSRGPIELQQFFTGEIDLDTELAKRFSRAPLLSDISLQEPARQRRASALLATQDGHATMTFDLHVQTGILEVVFTLSSMLSFRFYLGDLTKTDKRRWLELMRRHSGIAFLWTRERWENDYMIFVVRENFVRVYAFSPRRFEAAARITLDVMTQLLDWLEDLWITDDSLAQKPTIDETPSQPIVSSQKEEQPPEEDSGNFEW